MERIDLLMVSEPTSTWWMASLMLSVIRDTRWESCPLLSLMFEISSRTLSVLSCCVLMESRLVSNEEDISS